MCLLPILFMSTLSYHTLAQAQSIKWQPCDAALQTIADLPILCSNFSVPLDYTNLSSGQQHTLELIKIPTVNVTSKGSIIFNFGGPGGDGLVNLASAPSLYQTMTGGQHDVISFNPRGTSQHFMRFSCYETEEERKSATAPRALYQNTDASDVALGDMWANGKVFADTCYERMNETGTLVGTAFTARDIMSIIDALDQGPLLNYYGASYGSILGATTAAMFPDRIGRMILDGVENPHEYYHDFTITQMVHGDDAAFSAFLSKCVAAGPMLCPLASLNMTAAALETTIYSFFETLKANPIPFPPSLMNQDAFIAASIMDYSSLKDLIPITLYQPVSFDLMASGLNGLLTNNLSAVTLWRDSQNGFPLESQAESLQGIKCSDSIPRTSLVNEYIPTIERAANMSRLAGSSLIHGQFGIPCARWRMAAKERYTGDFHVATRNPVLLIGNQYDPVTPLVSAYNVSSGLEGSVVLERAGFGHVSLSQRSACVARYIAGYFINGTLPEPGTVCQPDVPIFSGSSNSTQ